MRYVIATHKDEGNIGKQLTKWEKEHKITIIERADLGEVIKIQLEKIEVALKALEKNGINKEIMVMYVQKKSGAKIVDVRNVLYAQREFMRAMGIKI